MDAIEKTTGGIFFAFLESFIQCYCPLDVFPSMAWLCRRAFDQKSPELLPLLPAELSLILTDVSVHVILSPLCCCCPGQSAEMCWRIFVV